MKVHPFAEVSALDVLHGVVEHAAVFTGVVEIDDVGVAEGTKHLDFACETGDDPVVVAVFVVEYFEGDVPLFDFVVDEIDRSHSAVAEQPADGVSVGDALALDTRLSIFMVEAIGVCRCAMVPMLPDCASHANIATLGNTGAW